MLETLLHVVSRLCLPHTAKVALILLAELATNAARMLLCLETPITLKKTKRRRLAVVTGGSRGIGREICVKLAQLNYDVHILSRSEKEALETIRIMSAHGNEYRYTKLDLCNIGSIEATVDTAFSQRRVDVLVSNAGVCSLEDRTVGGVDVNMATNYYGHFVLAHSLLRHMSPRRTRIVFTSSSVVFSTDSTCAKSLSVFNCTHNYSASKYCNLLLALHIKSRYRIPCVSVHPGVVQTALFTGGWAASLFRVFMSAARPFLTSPERAALNVLNAALHSSVSPKPGRCDFFVGPRAAVCPRGASAASAARLHRRTCRALAKLGVAVPRRVVSPGTASCTRLRRAAHDGAPACGVGKKQPVPNRFQIDPATHEPERENNRNCSELVKCVEDTPGGRTRRHVLGVLARKEPAHRDHV